MVWPLLYRFKILWLSCTYLVPRCCVMSLVAREVSAWCRGCLGEALAYSCREMWSLYAKGVQSRIRACRAVGRMVINHFALTRCFVMTASLPPLQCRTGDPAITDLLITDLLERRGMQIVLRLREPENYFLDQRILQTVRLLIEPRR